MFKRRFKVLFCVSLIVQALIAPWAITSSVLCVSSNGHVAVEAPHIAGQCDEEFKLFALHLGTEQISASSADCRDTAISGNTVSIHKLGAKISFTPVLEIVALLRMPISVPSIPLTHITRPAEPYFSRSVVLLI